MNNFNQKSKRLDFVFNPSQFRISYYNNKPSWEDVTNKKKKKTEAYLYHEVGQGLESDLQKLGIDITYSSKIIINEVAQNIILLGRLKEHIICTGVLRTKFEFKKSHTFYRKDGNFQKDSKTDIYEQLHNGVEVDPLLEKYLPKLHKEINNGLKLLGLLPSQQIEHQKLVIIKKLKQKYATLCGDISIEAIQTIK